MKKNSDSRKIIGIIGGVLVFIIGAIAFFACLARANYNYLFIGILLMASSLVIIIANVVLLMKSKNNSNDDNLK